MVNKIEEAINSALSLLDKEVSLIDSEDLRSEYLFVIALLEEALSEMPLITQLRDHSTCPVPIAIGTGQAT